MTLVEVLHRTTFFSPLVVVAAPVPRSVKFSGWLLLQLAMLFVVSFLPALLGSSWMTGARLLSSLLAGFFVSSIFLPLPPVGLPAGLGWLLLRSGARLLLISTG